jgi:Subtilisin inhibitor-like
VSVLAAILLASTSLHVTYWPNGQGHVPKRSFTLTCAPAGGTLPHRAAACQQLARLKAPFAPTPQSTACTQIYGGPHEAVVMGAFRRRLIRATFNRRNGCEIERWNRVAFLFPAA